MIPNIALATIGIDTVARAWRVSVPELQEVLAHYGHRPSFDGALSDEAILCLASHYEVVEAMEELQAKIRAEGRAKRLAANPQTRVFASLKAGGAASLNLKGRCPSFSGVAYGGNLVSGATATPKLEFDYVLDLAGMTEARGPKVNLQHDRSKRVGHVTKMQNDGRKVAVWGLLSAASEYSRQVAESAKNQYSWELSIEASMFRPERVAKGTVVNVNGREVAGPAIVFRKSEFNGLAFVDAGADRETTVEVFDDFDE